MTDTGKTSLTGEQGDWTTELLVIGTSIVVLTIMNRRKPNRQEAEDLDRAFATVIPDNLNDWWSPRSVNNPADIGLDEESFPSNQMERSDIAPPLDKGGPGELDRRATSSSVTAANHRNNPPQSSRQRRAATSSWQMPNWMTATAILLAMTCFWFAIPSSARPGATPAVAANSHGQPKTAVRKTERRLLTTRIDQLHPGRRVLALNPELRRQHVPDRFIDWETTRLVSLHQAKDDGTDLDIDTLIDIEALAVHAVEIWSESQQRPDHYPLVGSATDVMLQELLLGQSLELDLPEMGATGPAEITSIAPCPPIEPADAPDRRLVTTIFRHTSSDLVEVETQYNKDPITCTSNHPFWSADRHAYIPAGELRTGERLRQANGHHTQITRITPRRGPPTTVYNLEVDGQHVYFVGKDGLLVHNTCTTVIGRMDDLIRFDHLDDIDTWRKTGRIPSAVQRQVTLKENRHWLDVRIACGDRFGIATDPSTLPSVIGGRIPGVPNGYFTAYEYRYLQQQGIEVIRMW